MVEQQNAQKSSPKYIEVEIRVYDSCSYFAWGRATIYGVETDVFVGSKGHGTLDKKGRWWNKATPMTPKIGDILYAKICTVVNPGRKPAAMFWYVAKAARS